MLPSALLLVLVIHIDVSSSQKPPTPKDVEGWAEKVENSLREKHYFFDIIRRNMFDRKPTSATTQDKDISMKYEDVSEMTLVNEMAKSLSTMLEKKMKALWKSVEAAEKVAASYKWNKDLMKDDVTYENSKEQFQRGVAMAYEDRFNKFVNFNFSSVHIPVEIYDGNIDILNGLNWSAAIEAQFKANEKDDPDILWQYFGSQTGFMRSYPATNWPTSGGVDLYDVRRQSWYTQGSSSPKDMLILIDTSGSTHGQSLQLMQNAVKSILDTLGENDFVNIVAFAETASFVSKCFNHTAFVQANFRNKKQLAKDVDKLTAMGQADFSKAITFAFEKFKEFAENETNEENKIGANCNKVIMLLTDGGTDNAEDVFNKYNWPNKTVRVFTYAVGPTPNPINAIRWMACANRGYFSQIPAMGAIRARVQDYVGILAKPLALSHAEHIMWSSSHMDTFYDRDDGFTGLGMMTTVTLPVYNRSMGSSNQTILGVMGIDVTTAELEEKTPFSKIGPNGYSFAINLNGYVVFHPNLKTTGKFMTEPPNIDLLELEVDQDNPDLMDMRINMIEGTTNAATISTLFLSPDRRYVSYGQAKYAYTPIQNTTFRLGISVPIHQKKYPKFEGDISKFDWSKASSDAFVIYIAPWEYHKGMEEMKNLNGTIDDVIDLLKIDSNPNNWNLDLLFHLYWDVKNLDPGLVEDLKKMNLTFSANETSTDEMDEEHNRVAAFIMTNSGMTLFSPPSEKEFFKVQRDPRQSSIYKRALHSPSCIYMADYTEGKRANETIPYITTACGISIQENISPDHTRVIDKPAVVGERVTHKLVMDTVHKAIDEVTSSDLMTCKDESLICYLVDDGGFLVATSEDDYRVQIGRFFGEVDPTVFTKLNDHMFSKRVQYDFQATCSEKDDTSNAGFRDFYIPSLNLMFDMLSTGFWTSKMSWAFSSFNLYSWLFSEDTQVYADDEENTDKACVKATQQYFVKQSIKSYIGEVECQNCTRNFTAVKLNYTNLLFIVTTAPCEECEELYPPVSQAPREVSEEEEENVVCEMAQSPRKRFREDRWCYHADSREDASQCGCAALRASWLAACVILLSVMWRVVSASR